MSGKLQTGGKSAAHKHAPGQKGNKTIRDNVAIHLCFKVRIYTNIYIHMRLNLSETIKFMQL